MKIFFLSVLIVLLFSVTGCNSHSKSKEVASYKYEEEKIEMSDNLKKITPDWVAKGKICYGLVVMMSDGKPLLGLPVKAKVFQIKRDAIVMKSLENVSLVKSRTCTKNTGLTKGDIWEETEGDLFLTREEAIKELKKRGLYKNNDDKVTVD